MKKLRLVSMITMVAVLFATAGCVVQKTDEVSDALDKGQVASRVESLLIDLTADRDDREVIDAQDDTDVQVDVGTGPDSDDAQDDTDAQVDVGTGPDSSVSISHVPERLVRIPDRRYLTGGEVHVVVDQPEDHVAVVGVYHEAQLFTATGGSGHFGWSCTVNDGSGDEECATAASAGLYFRQFINSYNNMAEIKGTPVAANEGTLNYTITAYDIDDSSEDASIVFDLTVLPEGSDDPGPEDSTDLCDQQLVIEVVKNGAWGSDLVLTDAPLYSTREIHYKVTGGMAPYTWEWKSVVKDSHHCHVPQEISCGPFCIEKEIQEERYNFIPEDASEGAFCWGHDSVDERTRNPTWAHWTGESSEEDTETDFTTWKSAETDSTFALKGKFIYDGPLPLDDDVIEKLKVRVKDSCPAPKDDGAIQPSVTRKFLIEYPDDQGREISGEVEYKNKVSYGSGNYMKVQLFSQSSGDSDDFMIAESRLDVDDLSNCSSGTCDGDIEFVWNEELEDKGIDDVALVRVKFGLGHKLVMNDCFWSGSCGSYYKNGKMDVLEIEFGTTHWRFDYDDQDEGDDQMKTGNGSKGPFDISEISGVKLKRREYPRTFRSKWKSDDDGGNDNNPDTPW